MLWLLPSAVYSKSRAAGPCSRHHTQYRNWGSRPGMATLGNYRLDCSWTAEINPWICQVCVGLRGRSGNKMTFTAAATSQRGRIYDLAARLSLLTLSQQHVRHHGLNTAGSAGWCGLYRCFLDLPEREQACLLHQAAHLETLRDGCCR